MKRHAASGFVGRVGGLAVALGVGAVISLGAPTAWADDTTGDSAPGQGASSAPGSSSKNSAAQSNSPDNDPGAEAAPDAGTVKDPTQSQADAPSVGPGSEGTSKDAESADTNDRKAAKHRAPRKAAAPDEDSAAAASDRDTSEPAGRLRDIESTRAVASPVDTAAAAVAADVVHRPAAPEIVVASVTTSGRLVDPEPAAATPVVASVVVASKGSSSSQGVQGSLDDDLGSLAAPMVLALAAGARRELGTTETASVDTTSGQTTSQPYAAALTAAPTNQAPVITSATANAPGFFFGWVSGKFTATDADKDPLKYAVTTTAKGTVSFNSSTGDFTYAATAAAQHAAAADTATDADKHDVVTATVTDGKGGSASQSVAVAIRPANNAPTIGFFGLFGVSVGSPNATTGVVTGKVNASDADKDALKYTAASTSKGSVVFDATGGFTYTPTTAARRAAAATGAPWSALSETFKVTVTDGHGGTTTQAVTVSISPLATPTGVTKVGGTATLPGTEDNRLIVAGGARALLFNTVIDPDTHGQGVQISVVNTADGKQVGTSFYVDGVRNGVPVLVAGGTRAVVAASDLAVNAGITRIAVVDTLTGVQIGQTLEIAGSTWNTYSLGTNALIATADYGATAVQLSVLDTSSAKITKTNSIDGLLGGPTITADGSRAVFADGGEVAVVDTTTLTQIGTTVVVPGRLTLPGLGYSVATNAATNHMLFTSEVNDVAANAYSTAVTVVDIATGTQVGNNLTLAGALLGPVLNAAANHAVITTGEAVDNYSVLNTQVTVVDFATGAKVGSTLVLTGTPKGATVLSSDGTGALIATKAGSAAIIDTKTGFQMGPSLTITGRPDTFEFVNAARTRAVIGAGVDGSSQFNGTFRTTVIDTTTGAQIGSGVTVSGDDYGTVRLSADGTHALIVVPDVPPINSWWDLLTAQNSTTVAVIDTTTGTQTGSTLKLAGGPLGSAPYDIRLLSPGNTRFLVITGTWNQLAYSGTTQISVIDGTTGVQSGSTVVIDGTAVAGPLFNADGSQFLMITAVPPRFGQTATYASTLRIV